MGIGSESLHFTYFVSGMVRLLAWDNNYLLCNKLLLRLCVQVSVLLSVYWAFLL